MTASWYTPLPCVDCAADTSVCGLDEYYMVHDAVWSASGVGRFGGLLCVGCLEARIGRRLVAGDFTACPLNDRRRAGRRGSERLLDRMRAVVGGQLSGA